MFSLLPPNQIALDRQVHPLNPTMKNFVKSMPRCFVPGACAGIMLSASDAQAQEWPPAQLTLDAAGQTEVMAALAETQPARALPPVVAQEDDWNLFNAGEIHLEVSYLYVDSSSAPSFSESRQDASGFALGAHAYLSRYFSAGVEYLNGGDFMDVITTTFRLRVPLDDFSTALFVEGGVGALFDDGSTRWEAHLGLGLEVRLLTNFSFSLDFRAVESDADHQYMILRSGFSDLF